MDNDDNYKEDKNFDSCGFKEPIENDNFHLCKKHSEKWLIGEI